MSSNMDGEGLAIVAPASRGSLVLLALGADGCWDLPGNPRASSAQSLRALVQALRQRVGLLLSDRALAADLCVLGAVQSEWCGGEYVALVATVSEPFGVVPGFGHCAVSWVPVECVEKLPLDSGLARTWDLIRDRIAIEQSAPSS